MPGCYNLRVEYADRPHAVAVPRPRFSWLIGAAQQAYEIEVSAKGGNVLWRSGRVIGVRSSLIEYEGSDLTSNTLYVWRVRAWTDVRGDGPTDWVESQFTTALLDASQWRAPWVRPAQSPTQIERWSLMDWITGKGPAKPISDRLRPVQLIREGISLDAGVTRARLYAAAQGIYQIELNGVAVGDEVLAPGFDSYQHRISVQCYDVTDLLVEGGNVLGIALADGWWAGRIGLTGSSAQFGAETSVTWQLHLDYEDGSTRQVLASDDAFSAPGPWAYSDPFIGEKFDRRRLQEGWSSPGFDSAGWVPVSTAETDPAVLVPFTGEPVRRVATLPALHIKRDAEHGWIVDFGQVIAGRIAISFDPLETGQEVTIEHTETLRADGAWFQNIDGINKQQTDVYVAAGLAEGESYEPSFTFHGFRFIRIRGLADAPSLRDLTAIVLSSDLEVTGSFTSSDDRLNRLHENVFWSQRANFLSVPTDCPQRERAGWTGDLQVFTPASTNNAQVVPFISRWLANLRADQLEDGQVPIVSPRSPFDTEANAAATDVFGKMVVSAGWSDAIAFVPWALHERTGDTRVLSENYEAILRWVEYQRTAAQTKLPAALQGVAMDDDQRERQALLYNSGDHFGDWLTPSTLEGRPFHEGVGIAPALTGEILAPMFQAQTLTIAAGIAEVLERPTEAVQLAERAAAVRAAFAQEYVSDDGRLPVQLQGPYVIALAFDMVPEHVRAQMAAELARLVEARGRRLDTGFLSTPYLLDVLWDAGYRDIARDLLWQPAMPSWLYQVDRGATTVWESWDAVDSEGNPRAVSLNHYANGSVDDWLFRRIAGIQSTAPGYDSVLIAPDTDCGLSHAAATIGTPHGRLSVSWTRTAEFIDIDVEIPFGIDAHLEIGSERTSLRPGSSTHRTARHAHH